MNLQPLIKTTDLAIGYRSRGPVPYTVAGPVNLEMYAGQLVCLLGPNGSGKSTLLRTLAGLQPLLKGEVMLEGRPISRLKPAEIARMISLVLTDTVRSGNLDVYSLIALGRYPYTSWLGILSNADKKIIDNAIAATHTEKFTARKFDTLSDGEGQKVMLARALAQDTPLIMLDEPTAHVDLPSRIQLMQLLHRLAKEANKGILISTHELDLALQVADQVWLLGTDGSLKAGVPEDLVLNGTFEAVFNKEGVAFDKATGNFIIHADMYAGEVFLSGRGAPAFWTRRALQRAGFKITVDSMSEHKISIIEDDSNVCWIYERKGKIEKCYTIANLLDALKIQIINR